MMTKYKPAMVLNGRKLSEPIGDRRWRGVCKTCAHKTNRPMDTLRKTRCLCARKKEKPAKAIAAPIKAYANTVVSSEYIPPIVYLVQKNAEGGLCQSETCQSETCQLETCWAYTRVKEGPIPQFTPVKCTRCQKSKPVRLHNLKQPFCPDGNIYGNTDGNIYGNTDGNIYGVTCMQCAQYYRFKGGHLRGANLRRSNDTQRKALLSVVGVRA